MKKYKVKMLVTLDVKAKDKKVAADLVKQWRGQVRIGGGGCEAGMYSLEWKNKAKVVSFEEK